jgi:hypothetical protein
MSVAIHPSTTKSPQMVPPHHYIVSLKSWTETKNKTHKCYPQHHYIVSFRSWTNTKNIVGRCDYLHFTTSSCSKIPRAPTISQVFSFQNKPYSTFRLKPPKFDKNDDSHYNNSWNPRIFHCFLWSSLKIQTLDLLFPSWHSWHNERSNTEFKKRRSPKRLLSPTDHYQNPNKLHTSKLAK